MAAAREERENEMLALASIYDEDVFRRADSDERGEVHLCLDLPPDFKVVFQGNELICFSAVSSISIHT